jgi:tripartite-type tricarboxylate transporter receptor subunit TctC
MPWSVRSAALLMSICAAWPGAAAAAEYPDRPIRLIVPQAPGSATDVLARLLASELGPALGGAPIVVDNRPGGALTLGLDLTAKSPPDGYTLCMGPIGALAITRHMGYRIYHGKYGIQTVWVTHRVTLGSP